MEGRLSFHARMSVFLFVLILVAGPSPAFALGQGNGVFTGTIADSDGRHSRHRGHRDGPGHGPRPLGNVERAGSVSRGLRERHRDGGCDARAVSTRPNACGLIREVTEKMAGPREGPGHFA